MKKKKPLIIVGGGLAGSLLALHLHEYRAETPILLLESAQCFGGNHTWSFFDQDLSPQGQAWIKQLNPTRWPLHFVSFPKRKRTFDTPYNAINSSSLDTLVRQRIPEHSWRLNASVRTIEPDEVILSSGERVEGCAILDARGFSSANPCTGLTLGWQKFVGIEYQSALSDQNCAVLMDTSLSQLDGYRFAYVLPLSGTTTLIEDTYYSDSPTLDHTQLEQRIELIAARYGVNGPKVRKESGILPIVINGDPAVFWPIDDPIPRIGMAGGFFHFTTGYSLGQALALAEDFARLPDLTNPRALAEWSRNRFLHHWDTMRFFRLLNRMLFHACDPQERYRIFQHFYRLPHPVIARFYAGTLTNWDKARILSGRPPVSVHRALYALFKQYAD